MGEPGAEVGAGVRLGLVSLALVAILAFLGVAGYALARQNGLTQGAVAAGSAGAGKVFGSGELLDERPRPAPPISLTLFSGQTWGLAAQRGKPSLVNFWASWCPPCRDEVPVLQQGYQTYGDRVVFVGVDVWDTDGDARAFLQRYGATYQNGPDPAGHIAIDYGLTGVPETFLIDGAGRIAHHFVGPLDQSTLDSLLSSLVQA
jgi:cytochrome c biogenesis protein CcmG/thiol:disulfide interchange protein DsbE